MLDSPPSNQSVIPRWRMVNITRTERAGRILSGLAGADLAVTGALGHCPLYQKIGFVPPSLRRPR